MGRRSRVLGWTVGIVIVVALLAVFGLKSSPSADSARAAPQLPREHLRGPPATLGSLLANARGGGSLVVFWASWCGPCMREAPAVERFAQSAAGEGRIVGVDWSDGLSGAKAFIRRYRWTFPTLRDGEGLVGNSYRLAVLPTTFLLDGKGRIRAVLRGPQSVSSLEGALRQVKSS
jgi:cytochrome c biogenesis protein CcmG, thiol:disulfide interchange protein DsbE